MADNIIGPRKAYHGTLGTAIVQVFGMTAACTGNAVNDCSREIEAFPNSCIVMKWARLLFAYRSHDPADRPTADTLIEQLSDSIELSGTVP